MISAESFQCVLPPLSAKTDSLISCTYQMANTPSGWEVGSTVANWGILAIAAGALWVSNRQRQQANKDMSDTLEHSKKAHEELLEANATALDVQLKAAEKVAQDQMEAAHKANQAQLDAAYAATQAQLDASQKATQVDLNERKNARELEMTAEFVAALDEMLMAAHIDVNEEGRGLSLRRAITNTSVASGRFQLFVGHSQALADFEEQLQRLLDGFAPVKLADFKSRQYDRIFKTHAILRTAIVEYQKSRDFPPIFPMVLGALKSDDMALVDRMLWIDPAA